MRYGTGYHRPNGSERVREVQRRLTRLGYHTGPIDGLYGPLTRSSVQWFQIKHGLRPTGVVAATTLAILRDPKALVRHGNAQAKSPRAPSGPQPQITPTRQQPKPLPATPAASESPAWLVPAVIALIAAVIGLAALTLRRSPRSAHLSGGPAAVPAGAAPPPPVEAVPHEPALPEPNGPVLGYVRSDDVRAALPHEIAIRDACRRRGWTLARLVRDGRAGKERPLGRPGLSYALEQLTEGTASRLVVNKLEHLARSVTELRMVLRWFMRTGIALTALDVGLDTATAEGRTAVRALLSVGGSEQARIAARTRSGLTAARAGGRPAVVDRPELAGRIREMRAGGMTLQAIADNLNADGVPTVRGGACWRPSSVQSVLGYRRSRKGGW